MKVTIPVWKLVDMYKGKHPYGHFFDDKTLKFFGERLSDMRVLSNTGLQWHDPKAEQEYQMRMNGCEKKKLGTKECWFKGDEFVEEVL